MSPKRKLTALRNPMLSSDTTPPYEEIVERRKLGQTNLSIKADSPGQAASKHDALGLFDYLHLKVPLPRDLEQSDIFTPNKLGQYPEYYYLMRRSSDGFVSATGMFKAAFPYSSTLDQENEKEHHRALPSGSGEEIAGNVWIAPQDALDLADEYGITTWILALLDNSPTEKNKDKTSAKISAPPKFTVPSSTDKLQPNPELAPSSRARSKRSTSPGKVSASPRKIASPRKRRAVSAKPDDVASEATGKSARKSSKTLQDKIAQDSSVEVVTNQAEDTVKVEVNETIEKIDDKEIVHTSVTVAMPASHPDLPLPEDATAMIEKAKEMVEEANKIDKRTTKAHKRKASTSLTKSDDLETEDVSAAKKPRTELQEKLITERVRTRALLGLTATLVVGAIIPYFV